MEENNKEGLNISKATKDITANVIHELSGKSNSFKGRKLVNNTIAFMSASGGAGASTIVANVAMLAKSKGLSVVVLDLDILYPSQHIYFGIRQKITRPDIVAFMEGKNNLGECLEYKHDIGILYPNNRNITDLLNCESKIVSENLAGALDRLSNLFDLVLIDCPIAVERDVVNTALYKSDNIYLVLDDGVQSLINMSRIRNNFEATGIHTSKVMYVMNKRTSLYYNKSNLDKLNIELQGILPFDIGVIECGLRGELYIKSGESKSKASKSLFFGYKQFTDTLLKNGGYKE